MASTRVSKNVFFLATALFTLSVSFLAYHRPEYRPALAGWAAFSATTAPKVAIVMLAREATMYSEVLVALSNYESQFNSRFGYDYILFSEEPEPPPYIMQQMQGVTKGKAKWAQLDPADWGVPANIDQDKLQHWMTIPQDKNPPVGSDDWYRKVSYRFTKQYRSMCRFWSARIFKQPVLAEYEWIWRIDPDIRFHCTIQESPVDSMIAKGQRYGFAQLQWETQEVVKDLYATIRKFFTEKYPDSFQAASWQFITREESYNAAAFYTNFEIAHRSVFDNQVWHDLSEFIDQSGGIFYYRWGDSPIHTMFVSAYLAPSEVVYIQDLGYQHQNWPFKCPEMPDRCICNPKAQQEGISILADDHAKWWQRQQAAASIE